MKGRCPHCQSGRGPNWTLYAALILASVVVGIIVRLDREYRQVRELRQEWSAERCT